MYSDKENIAILTSLLPEHGISYAIVCPGSRNAPIVNNLEECPGIECITIVDERTAGFYAIGIAQKTGTPVAVCVTSGTALLNLAPAVAEAYYQHVPLLVISADRPVEWIDQGDGQTLHQDIAFCEYFRKSVSLPEPFNYNQRWHCNRLVNEALLELNHRNPAPVHINVPISDPLFNFTREKLPNERVIRRVVLSEEVGLEKYNSCIDEFTTYKKPMIVLGHCGNDITIRDYLNEIGQYIPVLTNPISPGNPFGDLSGAIQKIENKLSDYAPDILLFYGGDVICKPLKSFLRSCQSTQWLIDEEGKIQDTYMNLSCVIEASPKRVFRDISKRLRSKADTSFNIKWQNLRKEIELSDNQDDNEFSPDAVVRYFEKKVSSINEKYEIHYANSSSVRYACKYAAHYVWSNRGVNGIEGSLSTAAGMSMASTENVFCIIGDLSFFYDENALWNEKLRGNFRIILLNDGGGSIFKNLKGLTESVAASSIMGKHSCNAYGICLQNNVLYKKAKTREEMVSGIDWLIDYDSDRPMLLEINFDK